MFGMTFGSSFQWFLLCLWWWLEWSECDEHFYDGMEDQGRICRIFHIFRWNLSWEWWWRRWTWEVLSGGLSCACPTGILWFREGA